MVQLSSWVDLWDQATDFIKYHDTGINLHERLYKFLIDFAKLQKDAFIAQKRLCEKHLSDAQKCYGVSNSYVSFFNELIQIVQHIIDAENLISCSFEIHASSEGKSIIEDERRQLKRWKNERSKLSSELKSQTRIIDDEIKRYRDKYRDMVKAKEDYERINADQSHSQFDVEKALSYARLKATDFERARKDYSAALDQFNLYRKDYYFRCLPSWAQVGQSLEVERYTRTQSLINILYERLRVAIDRMNSVCDEFKSVCTHLNSDQDSEEIIKYLQSNNPPPGDIAFVDLYSSSVNNSTTPSTVTQPVYAKQQSNNSNEPIYSSGSVVLPSNFHCSVWAADHAALASSKQCGNNNYAPPYSIPIGETIYGESGSIYSTSYASTISANSSQNGVVSGVDSNLSRRPSASDNYSTLNLRNSSMSINGATFLRRIFSRRSRSVVNLKTIADLCDPGRIKRQQTIQTTCLFDSKRRGTHNPRITSSVDRPKDNTVTDASDFSDSNSEFENNNHTSDKTTNNTNSLRRKFRIHSTTDSENVAYATTSVLNGLPHSTAMSYQSPGNDILTSTIRVVKATTTTTNHAPSHSLPSCSDSQVRGLSLGREKSSIPLHCLATSGSFDKQDKLFTAPLAKQESASIVNPVESFSQQTSSSTFNRPPETLNGQMLNLKQNLITNRTVMNNNDDNSRHSMLNGNSHHTDINSNHNNNTLKYSQMNSSFNHYELKNSNQVSYNQNINLLKKHEQQELWYSQLHKYQQQQQPQDQSLRHHLKHEQRVVESTIDHNVDSTSSISSSYCHNQDDNNSHNHNNNNGQSKESQIVAVGDCCALYPFTADGFEPCYLAFEANEKFYILATDPTEDTTDWLHVCRKQRTQEIGYVPTAYVQKRFYSQPVILSNSKCVQLHDSDSSSTTTKTANTTTPKSKKSMNSTRKSPRSPVNNSVGSNRSINSGMVPMNRNFRGTSPYVRLGGVPRDTEL
ncbi:unnamed protein product [Schistosoma turkestanicum]|nr:unnamed protein product [Schistosoma turkestanicum]